MEKAPESLEKLRTPNPGLDEVSRVMNRNYVRYHITRQQLHDLQEWINKQKDLKE